jgi:hypothetical protein
MKLSEIRIKIVKNRHLFKFHKIEHSEPDKNFKNLSVAEKPQIVSWNEEKSRYRVIGARLGHDKATVSKVVIRDKQQEDTPVSKE